MQSLAEYCLPFKGAANQWPAFPLATDERDRWWQDWFRAFDPSRRWHELRTVLPQLWIRPELGASQSSSYQRLVLQGETPSNVDIEQALALKDPNAPSLSLVDHPCGPLPVLSFDNHNDFIAVVRCLAHRCEPASLLPTVHAQAVSGLIHWGLIREVSSNSRAQLLILHRAPYSSLAATSIPGTPTEEQWLKQSQHWRLEHELTHIACRRLVDEMRLNLFDELIADALGMIAALGEFSADLFRRGLGLSADGLPCSDARVHVYITNLGFADRLQASRLVLKRAAELETLLQRQALPSEPMALLRLLTRQRLDLPLMAMD